MTTSWLDRTISYTDNKWTKEIQMPEVREKERYTYLDFGKTVSRYFEKAATAMVKAPRCSLRVAASVADQGVN